MDILLLLLHLIGAGGSSVSTVSDYRVDDRDSIPGRGKGFFLYPLYPDQLRDPPSRLSNGHRDSFPGVKRGRGMTLTTYTI
jgi:hypothetical protein